MIVLYNSSCTLCYCLMIFSFLGLDFLNTNQDLVAIAEIKKMTLDNKEHIQGMKREFSMLARQNKPVYIEKNSPAPEYDDSAVDTLRGHLIELQTDQERFMTKLEQGHAEVVDNLNRKQVGQPLPTSQV